MLQLTYIKLVIGVKDMKKKQKKQLSDTLIDRLDIWPLIIAISIIPLLIRVIPVEYMSESIPWINTNKTFYDFYSYFKSQIIIVIGIISLLLIIKKIIEDQSSFVKDSAIIISAVALFSVLASSLLTDYPYIVTHGYIERYESVFVVLSYWFLFLLAYKTNWDRPKLDKLFNAFWITNIILSLIGIFQYFGYDILLSDAIKPFITSFKMGNASFTTDFIVTYRVIGQTLYHYNYVAFFITLSFPVFITKLLYDPRLKFKFAYLLTSALIMFNLLGSSARGGLLGLGVGMMFWTLFNRKILFKKSIYALILAVLIIGSFIGFETISDGFLTKRIISTFDTPKIEYPFENLYIEDQSIFLKMKDDLLKVRIDDENLKSFSLSAFLNDEQVEIAGFDANEKGYFNEPVLSNVKIYPGVDDEGTDYIVMDINRISVLFTYFEGSLLFRYPSGALIELPFTESMGLIGNERMGSGRGYIWSRSLPLILDKPILGYGPDTFPMVFPQYDLIGKFNTYSTENMIVDKAHNIYLQYAISSGLLYLGAYIALLLLYLFRIIKQFRKNSFTFINEYESIFFTGIIAYSVAGMFNDSTVHVSPVFWVFIGIGLALATKPLISQSK